jgi:hypothetical protein
LIINAVDCFALNPMGFSQRLCIWEVSMAQEASVPTEKLVQLRENLVRYFDEEELRTLCYDLGVDYDSLRGEGKAARARELVAYLERHSRIPEFVRLVRKLRPQVSGDEAPEMLDQDSSIEQPPQATNPATVNTLASSIVAALASYFRKRSGRPLQETSQTTSGGVDIFYETVKTRLQAHSAAMEALADLEAAPGDPDIQAALRLQLKKLIMADPALAHELRQMLEETMQGRQPVTFVTQVHGGEVGKIVNIGQADDVHID